MNATQEQQDWERQQRELLAQLAKKNQKPTT
jgi:hypothetical protein